MAGVNVDNVGTTFVHILDGATETLNQSSRARSKVRQEYNWKGSHLEHKLHTARNHAIGFGRDGSAFPVADKEDYESIKIGRKIVMGSLQLTDAVMATASKAPQVAVDVVEDHVRRMMKNILKFENFFFFRDGTGKVATCKSAASGVTFKVDDARALWKGATVQVYNGVTLRGSITITKVSQTPDASGYATVTFGGTDPGIASGDTLYWNNSKGIAYSGLDLLIDDASGTFQGFSVTNNPEYVSYVNDNGGTLRDLDPVLFRKALAAKGQKSGMEGDLGSGTTCLGTYNMLANMDELYEANVRLTPESKSGGVATPSVHSSLGKLTLEADSDAPYNKIFLADFSEIYRGVQQKLGFRKNAGDIFMRSDVSSVWTATAIEICEMYIKDRKTSAKIEDLNEDIVVAG